MNWKFWFDRAEAAPIVEPRVLTIPEEMTLEVFGLIDNFYGKEEGVDNVARYALWKKINSILPETVDGTWRLNLTEATKVKIKEVL